MSLTPLLRDLILFLEVRLKKRMAASILQRESYTTPYFLTATAPFSNKRTSSHHATASEDFLQFSQPYYTILMMREAPASRVPSSRNCSTERIASLPGRITPWPECRTPRLRTNIEGLDQGEPTRCYSTLAAINIPHAVKWLPRLQQY